MHTFNQFSFASLYLETNKYVKLKLVCILRFNSNILHLLCSTHKYSVQTHCFLVAECTYTVHTQYKLE